MIIRAEPATPLVQVAEGSMRQMLRVRDRLERIAGIQTPEVQAQADYFNTEEL